MIRNQIEAVVNIVQQPVSFLYGTANENNEAADRVSIFPLVMLYQLHPIDITLGANGSAGSTYDVYMEFMMQTKFEKNTADNETLVAQMELLARKFLVNAREYKETPADPRYFEFSKSMIAKAMPVYFNKDVNLTGVSLSFKVATRQDDYLLIC